MRGVMFSKRDAGFVPIAVGILVVLGLGSVAMIAAANNSRPGDLLYPVDTFTEDVRIALTRDPEIEVELRVQAAGERVKEVGQLLEEDGMHAVELDAALNNLAVQKAAVVDLAAQSQELKFPIEALENLFEQQEKELESVFKVSRLKLVQQKTNLEAQLAQALVSEDTKKAESLRAEITAIEAQLDVIKTKEKTVNEESEIQKEVFEEGEEEIQEEVFEEGEEELKEEEEQEEEELEWLEEELNER